MATTPSHRVALVPAAADADRPADTHFGARQLTHQRPRYADADRRLLDNGPP
ncbi:MULTISPECIES: hypothetical protein [Mycobacterium]|uniref:hypothetical protein n=1 Tax=Mycobacterium TaxID=1763 RepID=UPI0012FCB004|nr:MULTISPECIES: hypothetical protein [Mycobacterium]